LQNRVSELGK